jgi:hypothetical protein
VHIQPTPFLRLNIFFSTSFCCSIGERENRGVQFPPKVLIPFQEFPGKGFFIMAGTHKPCRLFCFRKRGSSLALLLDPLPLEGLDESGAFLFVPLAQGESP